MTTGTHQAEILRGQRQLRGDSNQQQCVLLRFIEPIPYAFVWEFSRIRMTRQMMTGGEGEHHRVELFAPQRCVQLQCPKCKARMQRVAAWDWQCRNTHCTHRAVHSNNPGRGVVKIAVPSDAVTQHPERGKLCSKAVLVLDRRYPERVLAAVYRTAGQLCDQLGWKLK